VSRSSLAACLCTLWALPSSCTPSAHSLGLSTGTLLHQGRERSVHVHLPPGHDAASPVPLVLALHGGCLAGAEVVLYRLQGGGHTWPGGWQYLPKGVVGTVCRDIDATREIFDFFDRHRLPRDPPTPAGAPPSG